MHPRYFVLEFRSRSHAVDPRRDLECRWRRLSDQDGAEAGPWTPFTLSAELEDASRKLRETRDEGQFVVLEHLARLPAQPSDLAPVPQSRPAGVALIHATQPEAKDIHGVAFEALLQFCIGTCGLMHVMAKGAAPQNPQARAPGNKLPLRVLLLLTSLDSSNGSTTDYTAASVAEISRALANSEFAASIKLVVAASASMVDPKSPTPTLVTAQARVPVDQVYRNEDDLERLLRYGGVDATKDNAREYDALITFGHSDAKAARDATGLEFEFPSADPRRVVIGGPQLAGWIGFPLRIVTLINCGSRSIADPFLNHAPHVLAAQPRQLPVGIGIVIARGLTRVLTGTHSIADAACQIRRELEGDGWMLAHLASEAHDPTFVTPEEVMLEALRGEVYASERMMSVSQNSKPLSLHNVHVPLDLADQGIERHGSSIQDFEDLLRQPHRRWVLRGDPGAGKSWTLRYCAISPWPTGRVILFAKLYDLEEKGPRTGEQLADYLEERIRAERRLPGKRLATIADCRSRSGLVVLLDAYDEVTDTGGINALLQWFDSNWLDAMVVVTCRKGARIAIDEGNAWRTAYLEPLRPGQRIELLRLLFQERNCDQADRLAITAVEQIGRGGPRMRELAGSPLMLGSIGELIVRELTGGQKAGMLEWLPRLERHELLGGIIEAQLAGEWADKTKRPARRTAGGETEDARGERMDEVRGLLRHVAWEMTRQRKVHVSADEVDGLLFGPASPMAKLGPSARIRMRERLSRDVGLLRPETADVNAKWSFPHRQLMETLAAEHLWERFLARAADERQGLAAVFEAMEADHVFVPSCADVEARVAELQRRWENSREAQLDLTSAAWAIPTADPIQRDAVLHAALLIGTERYRDALLEGLARSQLQQERDEPLVETVALLGARLRDPAALLEFLVDRNWLIAYRVAMAVPRVPATSLLRLLRLLPELGQRAALIMHAAEDLREGHLLVRCLEERGKDLAAHLRAPDGGCRATPEGDQLGQRRRVARVWDAPGELFVLIEACESVARSQELAEAAQKAAEALFGLLNAPDPEEIMQHLELVPGREAECERRAGGVDPRPGVAMWRRIPEGEFWMGTGPEDRDPVGNEIRHRVVLAHGFWMAAVPCTIGLYRLFSPQHEVWSQGRLRRDAADGLDGTTAVGYVSHYAAQLFCRWLQHHVLGTRGSEQTGALARHLRRLAAERGETCADVLIARLPTEAEWEYAARANTDTRFFFGNDADELRHWGLAGSGHQGSPGPVAMFRGVRPVASAAPADGANAFGLFDVHGNVWEHCSDWYDTVPATACRLVDRASTSMTHRYRVVRGGSARYGALECRSAHREWSLPDMSYPSTGLRLVIAKANDRVRADQ